MSAITLQNKEIIAKLQRIIDLMEGKQTIEPAPNWPDLVVEPIDLPPTVDTLSVSTHIPMAEKAIAGKGQKDGANVRKRGRAS